MPRLSVLNNIGRSPGWLLYGGRLAAYVPTEAVVTGETDEELDLRLTLDIVDGRLACVHLVASRRDGGSPVTGELLRRVPVARYVEVAGRDAGVLREVRRLDDRNTQLVPYAPPPADFAAGGMTDETLEQVSRVYAWAQASGNRASGVLLNDFGMSRPTSSRWLAAARQRGILREEHRRLPDPEQPQTSEEREHYIASIEAEVAAGQQRWIEERAPQGGADGQHRPKA